MPNSGAAIWDKEDKMKPTGVADWNRGKPGVGEYKTDFGNVSEVHQNVSFYNTTKTRTFGNEGRPDWAASF